MNRNAFGMITVFLALAALAGCNDDKKPATQVAAKVNDAEITVSQVNNVLIRVKGVTAENASAAKREILDKLIDQQLAVEQALDKKLDRNPAVMQAIEASRREILARAYLEQVAATQPKPTADEARKFYVDHPALFSQRRLYNLQELAIGITSTDTDQIRQWVSDGKSMQDIATALKAKNIQFRANAGPSTAEQLPLELLPKFQALKDGETTVIESPKALMVVHLLESKSQPIDEATALPRIEQFIANQRNNDAIAKEMRLLRDKANVAMLGEFALQPATPAAGSAATTAPVTAESGAPAPASPGASSAAATSVPAPTSNAIPSAPTPTSPSAMDDKTIAKGIAGIK